MPDIRKTLLCLGIALASAGSMGRAATPLDLANAELFTTHPHGRLHFLVDGDENTIWGTDGADLTVLPVNLFIRLDAPAILARAEIVTDDKKGFIRLTRCEIYGATGAEWTLLGKLEGNDQLRAEVPLAPVEVQLVRLRIMDTARPDHAFAIIRELRLLAAPAQTEPQPPAPAPVPDETDQERLFVDAACGLIPAAETTAYDPAKGYLHYARRFMDTMLRGGTDIYGDIHSPMFISILLLGSRQHPGIRLPTIPGQRQHDRAHFGGNLQHDIPLLLAMFETSRITGDPRYRDGAHAYLRFFLDHCAQTPTGLWPWGEHAHWDFFKEAPGHTTHEHLGAAPLSFWELAWDMNPQAVIGEAKGCLNHVVNLDTFAYNRHADILKPLPTLRPPIANYLDFPRHGGFYMQTWAFAYSKTRDDAYLDWIGRMLDHQQRIRLPESGLLPSNSTRDATSPSLGSTLSCAVSLWESVPLLGDTALATRVADVAQDYLATVARNLRAPAKPPGFTAAYGAGAAAGSAMLQVHAYRLTSDERFLAAARATAEHYAAIQEVPDERHIPAQVFGSIVNLMLDMEQLGIEGEWTEAAERYARQAVELLYHDGLFRGATGLWYYESELWVSNLVYALVRLHAQLDPGAEPVPPITFQR